MNEHMLDIFLINGLGIALMFISVFCDIHLNKKYEKNKKKIQLAKDIAKTSKIMSGYDKYDNPFFLKRL